MATLQYFVVAVLCMSTANAVHLNLHANFTLDYQINNQTIEFAIEANATGWVAVGFNLQNATMFNSDYMMGYVNGTNNQTVVGDFYVPPNANQRTPVRDDIQNWVAINGTEIRGITKLAVRRNLTTGDVNHDFDIRNTTIHLLWAYHNTNDSVAAMHSTRGNRSINLFTYRGDPRFQFVGEVALNE